MSRMFKFSSLLILLVGTHLANLCMIAEFLSTTFALNETCYWELQPVSFTTWNSAKASCDRYGGGIAQILDYHDLEWIGSQLQRETSVKLRYTVKLSRSPAKSQGFPQYLSRPAYIHSYNESTEPGVVNEGDATLKQMVLIKSGQIQTQDVDPDDIIETSVLCSTDMSQLLCPEISADNTMASSSAPHYLGDSVSFSCQHSSALYDNTSAIQTVSCVPGTEGPQWNTDVLPCLPLLCNEAPPALGNGSFRPLSYGLGVQLTYECLEGWVFADGDRTKEITCNETTGTWEPQDAIGNLTCHEEVCLGNVTMGDNSFSGPLQNRVGSTTIYWCDVGFRLKTLDYKVEVTCSRGIQPFPTWSLSTTPKCFSNLCPRRDVNEASLLGVYEENVEVGQVVIYKCNGNTLFPGGDTSYQMTCQETGEWDNEPPLSGCDETKCLDGWYRSLEGCYYTSDIARRYDDAVQRCQELNSDLMTVNSEDEKNRVTKQLFDENGVDYWIGYYKENGTWHWVGEDKSNYTNFAVGYPELLDCTRTSENGLWKDRDCNDFMNYICEKPAVCGEPPVVKRGRILSFLSYPIDIGAVVQYECDYQYNQPDGRKAFNSTCQLGGTWSWVSNCIETRCKPLNRDEMQVPFAMVNTDNNLFESVVTYKCINGYIFPDGKKEKKIECLENGQWTALPPSCIKIECPDMLTENSILGGDGDYSSGVMKLFRCAKGYYFNDGMSERVFSCSENAQWIPSNDDKLCKARICPKYYENNANISSGEIRYPNSVTVTCDQSYRYPDGSSNKTVQCTIDGTWNDSLTRCDLVTCPGPTPPPVKNTIRNSNSIKAGAVITYTCTPGYVFPKKVLSKDIYCDENTLKWTWRGQTEQPECITWKELKDSYLYVYPNQLLVLIVEWFAVGYQALCILAGLIYLTLIAAMGKRQVEAHFDIVQPDIRSISMINYEEKVEGDGGNLGETEPSKQEASAELETYEEAVSVGNMERAETPANVDTASVGEQEEAATPDIEEPDQDVTTKPRPKPKLQKAPTLSEISLSQASAIYGATPGGKPNKKVPEKKLKKQLTKTSVNTDIAERQTPTADPGVIPEEVES